MKIFPKKLAQKIMCLILTCSIGQYGFAQIQDNAIDDPGDIAFVGWNDEPDGFAFVLLDNCPASTTITFTDEEWNGSGFNTAASEGEVTWTNNTGSTISKGTVITIQNAHSNPSANIGWARESELGVNYNDAGDQWYAFTGTNRANYGTFLAFYGPLTSGATLAGTGLINGTTAIVMDGDYIYTGPTDCSNTPGACIQMIHDKSNWELIDETAYAFPTDIPTEFTGSIFTDCVISSIIAGSYQSACDGNNNTFSQEVIISYADQPTSGTLDVNGQSFAITGSPQSVVLTNLNATGALLNIEANFSANPACTRTGYGVVAAPAPCCLNLHLSAVNPITGDVTIKNCGSCSIDISDYKLTSEFDYIDDLSSLSLVTGNLNLTTGAEVTVNWPGIAPNDDGGADLGLYLPNGNFGSQYEIIDFVQWGSTNNGREAVAITAGLWENNSFINPSNIPPYIYTDPTCSNNGVASWDGSRSIHTTTTNTCTPTSKVISKGHGIWQHLLYGNTVIASFNDNGNIMGEVSAEFYIHNGEVRSDGYQSYLDRSVYITPTFQPSTPVTVRLYLTDDELNALIAADGNLNGIEGIHISKFSDAICANTYNGSNGLLISANDITTSDFDANHALEFNVDGFSGFFPGSNSNLLPVELLSFTGEHDDNMVRLAWQTESESNSDYFVLERSYDANDFQKIGIIKAAGNSNTQRRYNYIDDFYDQKEIIYYQLRQVDFDGTETLSNIIAVSLDIDNVGAVMAPNMATKLTTVIFNEALKEETTYEVFDISGRLFMTGSCSIGTQKVDINIQEYTAGNYFVKFTNNTKYYFAKFIKIRD